jgi:hypothetical protein
MTNQPQPGDAGTPALTVTDLVTALHTARSSLAEINALIGDLDRWTDQLPRHHRPDPEPTLLADFVPVADPDPGAAERAITTLFDTLTAAAEAARRSRLDLAAATAQAMVTFPLRRGGGGQPETVPVVAHLNPDSEDFEKQRRAAGQALSYHPRTQTWHGELPRALHLEPSRWQALIDVAGAGGGAFIQP